MTMDAPCDDSVALPPRRRMLASAAGLCLLGLLPPAARAAAQEKPNEKDTYDQDSIIKDASEFFGQTTEGLAQVIAKAFKDQGRPNAYIKGEEVAGAIAIGLRYGDGTLVMKKGGSERVFWDGPSIGFDLGANASKVFILVYNLPNLDDIFQRFPAVDGSLYYVGGAGVNYQRWNQIVLAPIRLGVGWRAGASIGYMHYTRTKTYNPL